MYLNDIPLGQRGSFAIFGVAGSGAPVLRQGRQQPLAGRSGDHRRRHPVAVGAVAVQQPGALPANGATSCCRRWSTPASSRQEAADARRERAARRRRSARSKPKRRTSSTSSARRSTNDYPGPDDHDEPGGRCLHDARSAPAAAGAGRRARRPDQRRPAAVAPQAQGTRGGGADRRRSARPARFSRWSAAARTTSRSTTARSSSRRQPGSVFKPFVYLTAFEQAAADGRDRHHAGHRSSTTSPTTWEFDDQVWTPENYEDEYDGPITFRRALAHSRNLATIQGRRRRPATTSVGGAVEEARRRHRAEAVSVDRARRVRGDAVRDRHGLHDLPEPGRRCGRCSTS